MQGSEPARRLEAELSALAGSREREARKVHDQSEVFRARVLAAQLARLRGASPHALAPPAIAMDYGPREARFAAEVLASGPARELAALAALRDPADPRGTQRRALALAVAHEELDARRIEGASQLASALAEDPADLSAALLAIRCASLAGHASAAQELLDRRARSAAPEAAVELALLESELALAREEPGAARRALGRALALGSARAQLALAWRDLEEGSALRGATLASSWLRETPAGGAEARSRGWICFALALLPPGKAHSVPESR